MVGCLVCCVGCRSEATYLKLYDCQSHLGMSEEGLSWLSQGFLDNPLSMRMREILNDISDYWAHVFRVQAGAAIRIQVLDQTHTLSMPSNDELLVHACTDLGTLLLWSCRP